MWNRVQKFAVKYISVREQDEVRRKRRIQGKGVLLVFLTSATKTKSTMFRT